MIKKIFILFIVVLTIFGTPRVQAITDTEYMEKYLATIKFTPENELAQDELKPDYYSVTYKMYSERAEIKSYVVDILNDSRTDAFVADMTGEKRIVFDGKERNFKIMIPKEKAELDSIIYFRINTEFYGYTLEYLEDFTLNAEPTKDLSSLKLSLDNRHSRLNIRTVDKDKEDLGINGVDIEILDGQFDIIHRAITDENGEIIIKNISSETLFINVRSIPDDYTLDITQYYVDIPYGEGKDFILNLVHKKNIIIIKNNVVGSIFELYNYKGELVGEYITDENGNIETGELEIGKYLIIQKDVKDIYNISDDRIIELEYKEPCVIEIVNELKTIPENTEENNGNDEINNENNENNPNENEDVNSESNENNPNENEDVNSESSENNPNENEDVNSESSENNPNENEDVNSERNENNSNENEDVNSESSENNSNENEDVNSESNENNPNENENINNEDNESNPNENEDVNSESNENNPNENEDVNSERNENNSNENEDVNSESSENNPNENEDVNSESSENNSNENEGVNSESNENNPNENEDVNSESSENNSNENEDVNNEDNESEEVKNEQKESNNLEDSEEKPVNVNEDTEKEVDNNKIVGNITEKEEEYNNHQKGDEDMEEQLNNDITKQDKDDKIIPSINSGNFTKNIGQGIIIEENIEDEGNKETIKNDEISYENNLISSNIDVKESLFTEQQIKENKAVGEVQQVKENNSKIQENINNKNRVSNKPTDVNQKFADNSEKIKYEENDKTEHIIKEIKENSQINPKTKEISSNILEYKSIVFYLGILSLIMFFIIKKKKQTEKQSVL